MISQRIVTLAASRGFFLLAVALTLAVASSQLRAQTPEKKPAEFEVRLPADAILDVDGHKTQAMGETRQFESPPMEIGNTYSYSLKATWHGKTVTREIQIRPGKLTTIDLREAFQTAATVPPPGSIALQVPVAVTLRAGQSVELRVRVIRSDYHGPVALRVQGLPEGVTAQPATIAAGHDSATVTLTASPSAGESSQHALLTGHSDQVSGRANVRIVVVKAKSAEKAVPQVETIRPPEPVVPPVPAKKPSDSEAPPPEAERAAKPTQAPDVGLELVLEPSELVLTKRESRAVHVYVRPKGPGNLDIPPAVKFEAQPNGIVQVMAWNSSMAPDRTFYTKTFAVRASDDAPSGELALGVGASASRRTASAALKITIKKAVPAPAAEPKLGPELTVTLEPTELTLAPGQTKTLIVRVVPVGAPALRGVPKIKVEDKPSAVVKFTPWNSSLAGDRSSYEKVYAVQASQDAPPAQFDIQVFVEGDSSQTPAMLRLTVAKAFSSP